MLEFFLGKRGRGGWATYAFVDGQGVSARQGVADAPCAGCNGPVLGLVIFQANDVLEAALHVGEANAGNGAAAAGRDPVFDFKGVEPVPVGVAGKEVVVGCCAVVGEVEN